MVTYVIEDGVRKYFGLSSDAKGSTSIPNGSKFIEIDTGAVYLFDEERSVWRIQPSGGSSGGGSGVTDHAELTGRDKEDAHPMAAVTGLVSALSAKQDSASLGESIAENVDEVSSMDVLRIWNTAG